MIDDDDPDEYPLRRVVLRANDTLDRALSDDQWDICEFDVDVDRSC